MRTAQDFIHTLDRYFGATETPNWLVQERLRALKRTVVSLGLTALFLAETLRGRPGQPESWIIGIPATFALVSWVYGHYLCTRPTTGPTLLYAFVIADPIAITGVLSQIPEAFALLPPFLLTVVVGSGIRYGVRTMYLGWAGALAALFLLFLDQWFSADLQLALSFALMLALVPLYFSSLVRQIHELRAIEAEHVRLTAMNEAVVARSAFLSKVSHELRSTLQSMLSALDVFELRHGRASEDDNQLIGSMRRSSMLLNTQLRDLLTLAKGEAGHLEMHPEPFEAVALVEGIADSVRELATSKGLEIILDLPADPLFVVADGARIDQVLTNLVINSIRYTHLGQVRLSLRAGEDTSRWLRFIVADTGPGISQETLPTLFAPDRIMTGPSRQGEGSGMGLAIVGTLVNHLGGKIAVASDPGRGTTFTLDVPVEPVDVASLDTEPGETISRILIVDDREDILDALVTVADELGYECDRASSSAVGANLLASRTYGAVLVDIDMPVKGGEQLVAETRRGKGPNRDARFIGMSADEVGESARRQFHSCLSKPIERAMLRQALMGVGHFSRPSQPGLWTEG